MNVRSNLFAIVAVAAATTSAIPASADNVQCTTVPKEEGHAGYERAMEVVAGAGSMAVVLSGKGGVVVKLLAEAGFTTAVLGLVKSYAGDFGGKDSQVCILDQLSTPGATSLPKRTVYFGPIGPTENLARSTLTDQILVTDRTRKILEAGRPLQLGLGQSDWRKLQIGSDPTLRLQDLIGVGSSPK